MSHTIANELVATIAGTFQVTVVNYTQGTGETFTLAELKLASGPVLPILTPSSNNSLAVLIFPVFAGGVLKLFQFVGGVPVEVATTANLNAVFQVGLLVSGQQINAF